MRPLIPAALIALAAVPALAETAAERAARCAAQSEIVSQAIEMRNKNTPEAEAGAALLDGVDERLAPSVPILVGYVYTLESGDLGKGVPAAFEKQCTEFKQ